MKINLTLIFNAIVDDLNESISSPFLFRPFLLYFYFFFILFRLIIQINQMVSKLKFMWQQYLNYYGEFNENYFQNNYSFLRWICEMFSIISKSSVNCRNRKPMLLIPRLFCLKTFFSFFVAETKICCFSVPKEKITLYGIPGDSWIFCWCFMAFVELELCFILLSTPSRDATSLKTQKGNEIKRQITNNWLGRPNISHSVNVLCESMVILGFRLLFAE